MREEANRAYAGGSKEIYNLTNIAIEKWSTATAVGQFCSQVFIVLCKGLSVNGIHPRLENLAFMRSTRFYTDIKEKFQTSNGWHINWNEIPKNVEVYVLALKDDNTIYSCILLWGAVFLQDA